MLLIFTGLCEIKAPHSCAHCAPTPDTWGHLEWFTVDGVRKARLRKKSVYYGQVQGQMGVTGLKYCDFFVYTVHGYHLERILFDAAYWLAMREKLVKFWRTYVAPEMLSFKIGQEIQASRQVNDDHQYGSQVNTKIFCLLRPVSPRYLEKNAGFL